MVGYLVMALVLGLPQVLFLLLVLRNVRFAVDKFKKQRERTVPLKAALIVPCRGLDTHFQCNIASLYQQQYEDYHLIFVVSDVNDEAYRVLCEIRDAQAPHSQVQSVDILTAGEAQGCGQKIHNMLHGVQHAGQGVDVLVFADADVHMRPNWLVNMVYPLTNPKHGAASGYRWFVPKENNSASIALSVLNARVVQWLGNTHFNHTWGGSMAIRTQLFHELNLDQIWAQTISDDYALSRTVKAAGKKVVYVPTCLNPSIEQTTWPDLLEFLQRQFIITRVCAPGTWWFALLASAYSSLGLWIPFILACLPSLAPQIRLWSGGIALTFFLSQLGRALLRQKLVLILLAPYRVQLRRVVWADVLLFPLAGLVFLYGVISSSWTNVVTWRGIRYRLVNLTKTIRLD